ncbi:ubiquinone biosynthesis protein UbiE [Mycobacterium intracellulare]|uniref:class I SAM-dependent methyltransferase n=1 Tax=Mycobacterium intracellulare TaxID=1767 RepID=UPI0007E9932A|nr:class I SAM-dependent methyltransferase [Mycobacterium intracellulare]OBH71054.1 ubiquinone biosynthesis protein UbiE [Mycobacterium intracellulare]
MLADSAGLPDAHAAIRAFWEREGSEYDQRAAHGISSEPERRLWTAALSAIPDRSRVLDIATGTGFVALLLSELGHRVTGVDASEAMLARARAKAAATTVEFVEGVTEELPFPDASFDAVTARHFIWTLLEPEKAFAEWRRVLAPDATLIADVSLNPHVAGHHYADDVAAALPFRALSDPAPVADALRSAGFERVRIDLSRNGGEYPRAMLRARTGQ